MCVCSKETLFSCFYWTASHTFVFLCLSWVPELCSKAEACVTHSSWHMKLLSCLEPAVRERREERWMWGVGGWNEGSLILSLSLHFPLFSHAVFLRGKNSTLTSFFFFFFFNYFTHTHTHTYHSTHLYALFPP